MCKVPVRDVVDSKCRGCCKLRGKIIIRRSYLDSEVRRCVVDFQMGCEQVVTIASPGENCAQTQKHRGCHEGQSLKRGCCCSVYRGCWVVFVFSRKVWFYGPAPAIDCTALEITCTSLFPRKTGSMAHTHAH